MDAKRICYKLKDMEQAFIDDLRPKYIMPMLKKTNVISVEEEKQIDACLSREDKVKKLIDFMNVKDIHQMKNFLKALREDEKGDSPYPWLADALDKKDELSAESHKTLVNGNIPFPVNHLLSRDKRLNDIRCLLKEACNAKRHWVVLYGPFGSGKTVLAAEAVRNDEFVEKIFPGGIYWIYFGYFQKNKNSGYEMEKIKEQMKTLLVWMQSDVDLHQDESIQNLKLCLRKEIVKRESTLIILDSVGSKDVINAFDIGCPVLVTTTDQNIMDSKLSFTTKEKCYNDFEEHEIESLISSYTEIPTLNMDVVAKQLAKKCEGSPLMATLISLRLADIGPNFKLWKEFNQKLENQGMDTVRRRRQSGDYNHDIEALVRSSLESIEDKKDYFYDFLVFAKDIPVPSEVLEILWDLSALDVKDIMNELHHRCFVEKVKTSESGFPSYIAHYQDIIKRDKSPQWLKERHKKLIEKLHILPTGVIDLTLFLKSYIPMALCYHLCQAEEYELLENVCLNLKYVEQKIHITGDPESLYMDYRLYRDQFQHPEHVQQFEEFVRRNASSICKKIDIFQLALFEPTNSVVYKKAERIIPSLNSEFYYNWCNKKDNDLHFNCKIWDVTEGREITHATFNTDGSLVAIATDAYGEIFSSATGEGLMRLYGHKEKVTYCAFNSEGDQLCTASEDTYVKIFNIDVSLITSESYAKRRMSMDIAKHKDNSCFTFKRHYAHVVCCKFSNDDKMLISSDKYGVIFVWEVSPSVSAPIICNQVQFRHSFDTFSQFSWDDVYFGAYCGSQLKIWNVEAPLEDVPFMEYDFELENPIVGFCFSKNNDSFVALSNIIYSWKIGECPLPILESQVRSDYFITCCGLSPDGNFLAYGTSSPSIIIINIISKHVVAYFQGHNLPIDYVTFSKNGKRLLSVSSNRYMIHDVSNLKDKPLANFAKNLSVRCKSEVEGDILIASSNYFNNIEVREGYEGNLVAFTENNEESDITALSMSYDCKEVVYGDIHGCVKVFNLDEKNIDCFPEHKAQITFIVHSKCNRTCFFTCSEDRSIKVWRDRNNPLTLRGHIDSVIMCVEFKSGDKLLSCSKDGTMKVWNYTTGEMLVRIDDGHGNADVTYCDISLHENLLASASSDETVKVWKSDNADLKYDFNENDNNASVRCCRFLKKRQLILVSGHDNGKVKLWNFLETVPWVLPEHHDSAVHNIILSEKDLKMLTLSNDIKLWNYDVLLKNIVLPSSSMGYAKPNIWASGDLSVIVVILNSVLYILRQIPMKKIKSRI